MKQPLSALVVFLFLAFGVHAQTAPATAELTILLNDFLAGASRNDVAMHDRFWADDLIYTRSAGRRIGKADVMHDARSAPALKPGDPKTVYSAEDVRIQQYGNTAIVAFRLVGTIDTDNGKLIANFLNTGTFLKRNGKWQAVSWQATRMPRSEEDSKKEVAAAETAFQQACLAADVKKLASLTDPTFIWTHTAGERMPRQKFLDELAAGELKYTKLESNNVTIAVYGDTAIVRGDSPRQRSAFPGSTAGGDAVPFTSFYTITFINQAGSWKAVAMHTSRNQN